MDVFLRLYVIKIFDVLKKEYTLQQRYLEHFKLYHETIPLISPDMITSITVSVCKKNIKRTLYTEFFLNIVFAHYVQNISNSKVT